MIAPRLEWQAAARTMDQSVDPVMTRNRDGAFHGSPRNMMRWPHPFPSFTDADSSGSPPRRGFGDRALPAGSRDGADVRLRGLERVGAHRGSHRVSGGGAATDGRVLFPEAAQRSTQRFARVFISLASRFSNCTSLGVRSHRRRREWQSRLHRWHRAHNRLGRGRRGGAVLTARHHHLPPRGR